MLGPYRTPPTASPEPPAPRGSDARVVAWLACTLGGARVMVAVAMGEQLGRELALAVAMLGAGAYIALRRT
jgi:hypothetical protein